MEIGTCFLNPLEEKQLIKNDNSNEEYGVDFNEISNTLSFLYDKKGLRKIGFEGPYFDASSVIFKYKNSFPDKEIIFTIN